MQSKLEVLTMRVNEVEEPVSDIQDKLMARKEAEEKRKKKDHEERLREINSLSRKKSTFNWGSRGHRQRQRTRRHIWTNHS